ncbi:MAG TPA: alkaline phosphatase D family protein [Acidimicrobiales bacterium]
MAPPTAAAGATASATTTASTTTATTSRRRLLTGAAVTAAATSLGLAGSAGRAWASRTSGASAGHRRPPRLPDGLFSLGVASGDPDDHSVVLWTRLAPDPLNGGGMPPGDVTVQWEVADDARFRRIVKKGRATARAQWAHSVHVTVEGLKAGRWYHYRFVCDDQVSPVGRTRTAPRRNATEDLRFLFASCQNWQGGFYTAWAHAPAEEPDLVVHLGDYIYEGGISGSAPRQHNSSEVVSLTDYRNRYALYKSDPNLQAAHLVAPWAVTWDDHEVENNYTDLLPQDPAEAPAFPARRAAAYQAWWEHQPVRLRPPTSERLPIYRALDWGRLARFHVLDTRQYRSDQACGEGLGFSCDDRLDPSRTMLGAEQERWVARSLRRSKATWDVLANQCVMTSMPLGGALYNPDQWDGYAAARTRLFDSIRAADVDNAVVITGDIHASGVGGLVDEGPDQAPIGTELVGTSISSNFDPALVDAAEQLIGDLPHVEWVNARQRGYVACDVSATELVARYRLVDTVAQPTSPIGTATSWRIEAGRIGVDPA